MFCLPATVTTAYFIAIILLDLINRDWNRVPGHALFGVFAVLLVSFICQRGSEPMAWILMGAPFIFLFLGYMFRIIFSVDWKNLLFGWATKETPQNTSFDSTCPCCQEAPCHCISPCPIQPKPTPNPTPKPCPAPPRPKPCAPPKPEGCIKGSLSDD